MPPIIRVFCIEWQVKGGSATDLISDVLQNDFEIEWRHYDPQTYQFTQDDFDCPLIWFHQFLPQINILNQIERPIIWTPMWDNVQWHPQSWWDNLPKALRVVAFSDAVYQRASQAGLSTLRLHYYKNPQDFQPVDWSKGRVLLYWNRVGLVNSEFLERLCMALRITKLLFRGNTDPYQPDGITYAVPERFGDTMVETIPDFKTRDEYLYATREANIFLAPRTVEGVGMAFLEAMARGCAVLAYDQATMNEYITTGQDGYLFKRKWTLNRILRGMRGRLASQGIGSQPPFKFPIEVSNQDWASIESLNVEQLGQTAYQRHQLGYQLWQSEIEKYATFVLGNL